LKWGKDYLFWLDRKLFHTLFPFKNKKIQMKRRKQYFLRFCIKTKKRSAYHRWYRERFKNQTNRRPFLRSPKSILQAPVEKVKIISKSGDGSPAPTSIRRSNQEGRPLPS
jgi:hypothetical protein